MKRRKYIVVMMMSLLLGSCSSEDILSVPNGNGRIRFDVGVSQSEEVMEMPINTTPMTCGNDTLYAHSVALRSIELHNDVTSKTRGTEVNESSFHNNFGLYGYTYDSGQKWADNGSSLQPTIKNENIAKDNPWTSSAYFPGKTKNMAFFAYAPYTTVGIDVTDGKGAPQLTYTINSNVSEQKDLLVANNVDVAGDASTVALDFKHALTAVKFAVGTITGFDKITKIKISGVKNSGTLSLDGDNWSLSESTASYTIDKEIDLSTTSGDITGSSNDLMFLMPQTFSDDNAKLEVTMTNDIGTATFSTSLNGEWKKGYTVKYTLSVERVAGDFHFEVSPSTTSIPKEGGEFELKVKSFYQYSADATKIPIPWSGKYIIGNNEYSLSGDGSVNDDIRKISVPANNSTLTHTQTLAQNPSKGTADKPWNLSNSQGEATVENTANCYVVNSQGTYSIPLVYGCAIKNGENNTKSYESSTFVNHEGKHITDPYIFNMVTADGAKLVWQDVQNMITVNSELGDNGHSLIFTIGENIAQGNAVVAATVNGTVAWSWHIWVTDRDVSVNAAIPTKAFDTSKTYNFMPVPLGWCDVVTDPTVAPCNFYVSLYQRQSGKNLSTTIAQAGSTATSGNFTYYQWGRKDPFVGSTGTDKTCKTWYDRNGTQQSSLKANNSTRTKVYGITNPECFIYGASQWDTGTTTYDDWNANLSSNTEPSEPFNYTAVEKTVYDPSPVGYKLPPTKAFTGFAKADATGSQTANGSGFNGGWNFYTGGQSTEPTDFWIAGGYRNRFSSGSLSYVGSEGYYWSAGPYSNEKGCRMYFNQNAVNPRDNNDRAWGFSVRPVSEQ